MPTHLGFAGQLQLGCTARPPAPGRTQSIATKPCVLVCGRTTYPQHGRATVSSPPFAPAPGGVPRRARPAADAAMPPPCPREAHMHVCMISERPCVSDKGGHDAVLPTRRHGRAPGQVSA
jgi:hypothetical protein